MSPWPDIVLVCARGERECDWETDWPRSVEDELRGNMRGRKRGKYSRQERWKKRRACSGEGRVVGTRGKGVGSEGGRRRCSSSAAADCARPSRAAPSATSTSALARHVLDLPSSSFAASADISHHPPRPALTGTARTTVSSLVAATLIPSSSSSRLRSFPSLRSCSDEYLHS